MSLRLDEMKFEEVKVYYKKIVSDELSSEIFKSISDLYEKKYNQVYNKHYVEGYKVSGGMGRGFKYILAMLYGWYIEELIFNILLKNIYIQDIEYAGNDSEHEFIFDDVNKKIKIAGEKTTNPDFLITLKNGKKFYIELKTAAAGVFTIKKGNVMQLYKTIATTNIYSIILMVDIVKGMYTFKDLNYFSSSHPFVNQRMEGQLCYNFPIPDKDFIELIQEDFMANYNDEIFDNEIVFKYKILNLAKNCDPSILKIAKNKLSYDNKVENFSFQKATHETEIEKIIGICP